MDLILRGGRVIDPASGLDATCDVGFANGRVAAVAPRIAEKAERGTRCRGRHRHARHDRPAHPRLLGRHVDRRRGRADRAAQRHHDVRRRRHCRARRIFPASGGTSSSRRPCASSPTSTSPSPASSRSAAR